MEKVSPKSVARVFFNRLARVFQCCRAIKLLKLIVWDFKFHHQKKLEEILFFNKLRV